jgi:hypothetical protein
MCILSMLILYTLICMFIFIYLCSLIYSADFRMLLFVTRLERYFWTFTFTSIFIYVFLMQSLIGPSGERILNVCQLYDSAATILTSQSFRKV